MSTDPETLRVYAQQAQAYAQRFASSEPSDSLRAFIAALPPGARVLDLGCGPGQAAAYMQGAGLKVTATDASPEMVALARANGVEATRATFDDLDETARYDGIWANFSLLHAPRADFSRHLAALARALKPGGHLHLGLKTGTGEGRDRLGRFYTYHQPADVTAALASLGLSVQTRHEFSESGLAGPVEPGFVLLARKD